MKYTPGRYAFKVILSRPEMSTACLSSETLERSERDRALKGADELGPLRYCASETPGFRPGSFIFKSGFTLVELMVAVAILAIGIASILRALLQNVSALESGQCRIEAVQFLLSRMASLEEQAIREGGVSASRSEEEVLLSSRKATFTQEVFPLEAQGLEHELCQARLMLVWKEGRVQKDAAVGTYFASKKQK